MISIPILVFVIPINALIIYVTYKGVKEKIIEINRIKNAKKNLLNEIIEINLDGYEVEILDDLSKGDRKKYLRNMIKEVTREWSN